jgi:hypothetical protein
LTGQQCFLYEGLQCSIGNDLLALELGGLTTGSRLGVSFGRQILVSYGIAPDLITHGGDASSERTGNGSKCMAIVEQNLYFIPVSFCQFGVAGFIRSTLPHLAAQSVRIQNRILLTCCSVSFPHGGK